MKKRILASLMSLCLLVGLLPTTAFAAENDVDGQAPSSIPYTELDEGDGDTPDKDDTASEECQENTLAPADPAEDVLEAGPADTTGDKTVPGWMDDNGGHAKQIQATFDFVVDSIAYKKLDDATVEVAPWYCCLLYTSPSPRDTR